MNRAHRVLDPSRGKAIPKGLCALAIMTKAPHAGRVKTRLTPPLTPQEAAALNVCFLRDTSDLVASTVRAAPARGIAVYTPAGTEEAYAGVVPDTFELLLQRGEALEERIMSAIEDLLGLGFDSVCLINSDSPTVPPRAFAEATRILSEKENPVVLGPSDDGGYYLIGLKKLHRPLFENIRWSTEQVLEQTLQRAQESDLGVHLLPPWYDVDNGDGLRRLCRELFAGEGHSDASPAPATRKYLEDIMKREGRERIWPDDEQPCS